MDPQGKTVQVALEHMGYSGVQAVHVGKYIEIELADGDPAAAERYTEVRMTRFAEELLADREIVVVAVQRNWHALDLAAEELLADRAVVLDIVKQDWGAIVSAAEELRLATQDVQVVAE